jgi:hypothetical protein
MTAIPKLEAEGKLDTSAFAPRADYEALVTAAAANGYDFTAHEISIAFGFFARARRLALKKSTG